MNILNWLRAESSTYCIEVAKGPGGWFWRLLHVNGKNLAHSESYSSKHEAIETATNLGREARFPVKVTE